MGHPNDDTGDVLRRLESKGDDLTRERDINFSVVFPNQFAAERFAEHFREEGYSASVKFAEVDIDRPWDVTVVSNMTPSHQTITDFEDILQEAADSLNGRNDGWGCFTLPGKHLH